MCPAAAPCFPTASGWNSVSGSLERLVVTRQGTCGFADQVSVILADPNRLDNMLRRYRERQELYEQEEEEQKAKEEK